MTQGDVAEDDETKGKVSDVGETVSDEATEIARALGQAYWRQLNIQAHPDVTKEQLREQLREQWGGNRREYTKLGHMVMRQLSNMGFSITKTGKGGGTE